MAVHVVGSINVDIIASVDRLPAPGETVMAGAATRLPGGKGGNQAVAAARMGSSTYMAGMVGDEEAGRWMRDQLAGAGVDVGGVRSLAGGQTGTAYITVDKAGENQIVLAPGANLALDSADPVEEGVLLSQLEVPVVMLADLFARSTATRILNAAPPVREAAMLFGHVDILIVNQHELAAFLDLPHAPDSVEDVLCARALLTRPDQAAIVTLGAGGAVAVWPDRHLHVLAMPVTPVDTIGAGDCFCGALASLLDEGRPLEEALFLANAAAALATQGRGAAPSMPERGAVETFVKGRATEHALAIKKADHACLSWRSARKAMMTTFQPTPFGLPSDTGGKDFGIFLPIANGGWILSRNKPVLDGSYAYNRKCALLAEEAGLDFIMSMSKFRGYGGETEHWNSSLDPIVLMAALAEVTSRVKVWTTLHTLLQNPGVAAKMLATLQQVAGGRAGLNMVTGSYKGEFAQMGAWPEGVDHDQRYDLAYEWIRAIKALWSEDSVTMHGDYFTLDECQSWPKPEQRPFLVCAGSSEKGMRLSSEEMDAIFLSGGNPLQLAEASRQAKEIAAEYDRSIRTYSMLTIVLGDTQAQARATADHFRAGLDEGALWGMMRAYGFLDAEIGKENAFVEKSRSGFMSAHLLGTPSSIVEQITELFEVAQTDGLMLIFPDYHRDIPIFGQEVLPVLRERFPGRVKVTA